MFKNLTNKAVDLKTGQHLAARKHPMAPLARLALACVAVVWAVSARAEAAPEALKVFGAGSLKAALGAVMADIGTGPAKLTDFLDSGQADLLMVYCSSARAMVVGSSAYRMVNLPPSIQISADYALTVAKTAHPQAAQLALYMLSPAGQARLAEFGFQPVALPASEAPPSSTSAR